MSTKEIVGIAVCSFALAFGCAAQSGDDSGDDSAQGEDQNLNLRRGNIDHAAIVEVTTMMLAGGPTDGLLDPYNEEDPFRINAATYAGQFARRLARFDAYDGKTNWQQGQATAWVSRIAASNYLVVDTSKPCNYDDPHTYLEIERAHLTGRDHTTCGGRMPNEDALDVTVNFLVRGPSASVFDQDAIHDGVDQATQRSTDTFPYLAELNGL